MKKTKKRTEGAQGGNNKKLEFKAVTYVSRNAPDEVIQKAKGKLVEQIFEDLNAKPHFEYYAFKEFIETLETKIEVIDGWLVSKRNRLERTQDRLPSFFNIVTRNAWERELAKIRGEIKSLIDAKQLIMLVMQKYHRLITDIENDTK